MEFNFIAVDQFSIDTLDDLEKFVAIYPDFQTVMLADENELTLLLKLMEMPEFVSQNLNNSDFSKFWDLSGFKLPELDNQQFDKFYENWIQKSHRENNMDEYGNLIFLQGLSTKWNKLKYRLIVKSNI
ncbi:hypothetical protein [Mucilaginibacter sp. UR6-11]|uniref:hypothetical protein n=1 Tax=Mucilaginibacter sp. UR6-11 TaxID=1435644 RepID=UPI001E50104E|nr:hypothetical protein [Mucilaginibacter sp. UR6-11]MCC8425958.1 hypothetical protein [Mucilaginibacter sp. UR6-11]